MINKFFRGASIGILLVVTLWFFVSFYKNSLGYGMAILPLIIISIILFIIGFAVGTFILKHKKKNGKKNRD